MLVWYHYDYCNWGLSGKQLLRQNDGETGEEIWVVSRLFQNKFISLQLGFSLFLFLLITSPAFEKTLSQGTEVAGMCRYLLASLFRLRYTSSPWLLIFVWVFSLYLYQWSNSRKLSYSTHTQLFLSLSIFQTHMFFILVSLAHPVSPNFFQIIFID